jgi:adenylate kinase family enzyme
MPKIIIIGNGGTGKSLLGEYLSKELGIPVTHLDQLTMEEGWSRVPLEEFTPKLEGILKRETWIVEGWSYHSTLPSRLAAANIILHLDFPIWYCYWNALKRHVRYTFQQNPYDPPNSPIWKKTNKMVKAMWYVYKTYEPEARKWLGELKGKRIYIFHSRRELKSMLKYWKMRKYSPLFQD